MSHPVLYRCEKLHATISLEQCKRNRAEKKYGHWGHSGYGVFPPAQCKTCTDWMQWGKATKPVMLDARKVLKEVTVGGKLITCAGCGQEKKNAGRGYCSKCYQRLKREEKKEFLRKLPPMEEKEQVAVLTKAGSELSEKVKPSASGAYLDVLFCNERDHDLRLQLQEHAESNYRTLEGEILYRLQRSLEPPAANI